MSDEPTTIEYLTKHLLEEISIKVEVEEIEPSDSKTPAILRFIVENTRDPKTLPNIVFKDVNLIVGIPPDMNTINIPKLSPGESHVYEHRYRYSELPLIQYNIKGNISPESLFQFETRPTAISPDRKWAVSIGAYKKMIAELDIHKWVAIIPKVTLIPEPNTTLSQLKEQENRINNLIKEVGNARQQFQDFSRFLNMDSTNPKRESIINHRNMIMDYFKEVVQGMGELLRFYSSKPEIRMIEATKNKIVSKLSTLLQKIDEDTVKLVD